MRVLVVDDNAMVRATVRVLLETAGMEVVEADSGRAAVRAYQEAAPVDLVICDLFMPDVDGLEVLRQLRRLAPRVKVIAMSGGAAGGSVDLLPVARKLGAAAMLYKPFTQKTVLETIRQVC